MPSEPPVAGTSDFAKEFAERGPFDKRGRSLRQFDLSTRLFKYPCSYLVYSKVFAALPKEVKDYVLRRLHEVLTGKDTSEAFAHLLQNLSPETGMAFVLVQHLDPIHESKLSELELTAIS